VTPDLGSALLRLGSVLGVLAAALGGLVLAVRWMSGEPVVPRRRAREPHAAVAPRRPLQEVAADLRRLTAEVSRVPAGAPVARRRGLLAAYDDLLVEAAVLLDVPHALRTTPPEVRELERIRLLGQLEAAGLVVSD
jgi:hypothetical protein